MTESSCLDSNLVQTLYSKASDLFERKSYREALPYLNTGLEITPYDAQTNMYRAVCSSMLGTIYFWGELGRIELEKALDFYAITYELLPNDYLASYNLGVTLYKLGFYDDAEPYLLTCSNKETTYMESKADCANYLGLLYDEHQFLTEKSILYFRLAHTIIPKNKTYLYNLANALYKSANFAEIVPLLIECVEEEPNLDYAISNYYRSICANGLGILLFLDESDYPDKAQFAASNFALAYELSPNSTIYAYNAARTYIENQYYNESIPYLKECSKGILSNEFKESHQEYCITKLVELTAYIDGTSA